MAIESDVSYSDFNNCCMFSTPGKIKPEEYKLNIFQIKRMGLSLVLILTMQNVAY